MKRSDILAMLSALWGIIGSLQENGDWFSYASWTMFAIYGVLSGVNAYLERTE